MLKPSWGLPCQTMPSFKSLWMRSRRARRLYRSNWQLPRMSQICGSLSTKEKLPPRSRSWRNQSKRGREEERGREGGGGRVRGRERGRGKVREWVSERDMDMCHTFQAKAHEQTEGGWRGSFWTWDKVLFSGEDQETHFWWTGGSQPWPWEGIWIYIIAHNILELTFDNFCRSVTVQLPWRRSRNRLTSKSPSGSRAMMRKRQSWPTLRGRPMPAAQRWEPYCSNTCAYIYSTNLNEAPLVQNPLRC